jgi:hypothetical protein
MSFSPRRLAIAALVLPALLAGACTERYTLPAGSEGFEAPPEYELWWSMTEACSGLRGSLADVDWYVVPNSEYIPGDSRELGGEWYEEGNRIILASEEQHDGSLVRHEMLHALTRANHTRLQFLERCAGIVVCAEGCMRDAGPAPTPPAGTPLVSPTALEVSVEVQPAFPSGQHFGGYFTIVVSAHNPQNHAVQIALPPSGDDGPSLSFTYSVSGSDFRLGSGDRAYDAEGKYFEAGETKREAFDMHLGGDPTYGGLPAGNYTAYGAFGDHGGTHATFTLTP